MTEYGYVKYQLCLLGELTQFSRMYRHWDHRMFTIVWTDIFHGIYHNQYIRSIILDISALAA